jgi:Na+-driven multidrug efflux pump
LAKAGRCRVDTQLIYEGSDDGFSHEASAASVGIFGRKHGGADSVFAGDLYWVGRLGKEAIGAVGVAGNITMSVLALTQMLGVGTTTLISQAAGRKDQAQAELVFNQSFVMSILIALSLGVVGFILRPAYCEWLSPDAATATLKALFLPVVALSFAVSPVVGQNFGGRQADRVRHSVYSAIGIASLMMLVLTLLAFLAPATLIRIFSRDPRVIAFGSEYLRIVPLNFISAGIVFVTSSIFQGIGNTLPPLFSSITRLILFAVPALLISRTPGFEIRHVWYLSVGSIVLQMCVNLLLLRYELRRKLRFEESDTFIPASATAS